MSKMFALIFINYIFVSPAELIFPQEKLINDLKNHSLHVAFCTLPHCEFSVKQTFSPN